MSSNSTTLWEPPHYPMFNFSCAPTSAFVANLIIAPTILGMNLNFVLPFLRSLDNSSWTENLNVPEDWELLQWWHSQLHVDSGVVVFNKTAWDFIDAAAAFVEDHCDRQTVCNYVPLEGDPDLAGIGVSFQSCVCRHTCSPW